MDKKQEIRELAESDLEKFINLVHPQRVLGAVHKKLIRWWTRQDAKSHQLTLLPRDHMKSALVAYWTAWMLTRNPTLRILYISSTSNLATKQLKFIKDILTCDQYRFYWPEMVNVEESKREKWTETEISLDHPLRKKEAIRDPSIFTGGLTTSLTGLHCDIAVLDDVVVQENAYTEEGREKVRTQYSLLSSIEGTDSREMTVGTRYHPKDLYNDLIQMRVELFDEEGEIVSEESLYEKFEEQVETVGDGTGEYLWPRQQRYDGKWFGFDQKILAKKKAAYLDKTQFRAQYYNNPNDASTAAISPEYFQYYERSRLRRVDGKWTYNGRRLNIFAAIDFAYSKRLKADYTAIVVLGCDTDNNYYVLDIERFKTTLISDYFAKILVLHQKWDFRKIRCEVTSAQMAIVEDLKQNYIRKHGLALSIEEHKPTRHEGSKEERMEAVLQPRYANLQVWHYQGGNCQTLEDELILQNPPHDDVKDALASAIEICVAPSSGIANTQIGYNDFMKTVTHNRFGGVAF